MRNGRGVDGEQSKSRQQLWAEKQLRRGNCRICGAKRKRSKQLCDFHLGMVRAYQREKRGRVEVATA